MDEKEAEKDIEGTKTNGSTSKWSAAKAAYQQKQRETRGEEEENKEGQSFGSSKKNEEKSRQWYQEAVNVNLASAQGETPLAIARALGHVACAVRMGIHYYHSSLCFVC